MVVIGGVGFSQLDNTNVKAMQPNDMSYAEAAI
jgi:hypothetical protein